MLRTNLRNIFPKNITAENRNAYSEQRNLHVTLLGKSKRGFFWNLDEENLCASKNFWNILNSLLSNKVVSNEKITLVENNNTYE